MTMVEMSPGSLAVGIKCFKFSKLYQITYTHPIRKSGDSNMICITFAEVKGVRQRND